MSLLFLILQIHHQVQTSQPQTEAGLSLSDAADIANVVVAALAFGFSIYTFWKQKEKDRQDRRETAENQAKNELEAENLRARTIRLQWYKDMVITPNIQKLHEFYETLHRIRDEITTPDLNDDQKDQFSESIKEAQREVRKTLVDSILPINSNLHDKVLSNLDQLVDKITNSIFDDTLKLSNGKVNEVHIGQPISDSKRNIFTLIYSYRGE